MLCFICSLQIYEEEGPSQPDPSVQEENYQGFYAEHIWLTFLYRNSCETCIFLTEQYGAGEYFELVVLK